jgi:hypothetical protein
MKKDKPIAILTINQDVKDLTKEDYRALSKWLNRIWCNLRGTKKRRFRLMKETEK